MTAHTDRKPARKGAPAEAARVLADLRRIARPVCEECGAPARDRFAIAQLCDRHVAEAMATAYAMETGGAL